MGYYTTVEFELQIKIDLEEFEEKFEEKKQKNIDPKVPGDFWQHEDLKWDEDGWLWFDEPFRKFYDEEELVNFLKPYVKEGDITCRGEEGETWRWYFDGKGGCEYQSGTTIFAFDPYKEFMKKHGEELPEDLKRRLEEWNLAKRV